jgi:uncharacterized protein (TIGR02145 family)
MRSFVKFLVLFSLTIFSLTSCIKPEEVSEPVACFEVSKENATINESISFTNCSQNAESYIWNFGDGTTSTEKDPVHAYAVTGLYTVSLLVENEKYNDQITHNIRIEATLPIVSTSTITNITSTSALGGGNITSDGGREIISRGVCWSTSENPTLSINRTNDGSGIGNFVSSIAGLTDNTSYYVRAYAINSEGTSYGNQVSFVTTLIIDLPIVSTNEISEITKTSAVSGGYIVSDGGAEVTVKGVCWSTSENPTIDNNHSSDGSGNGEYTSNITGLTENTTYYVRAYATNSEGTDYGSEKSFTTTFDISIPTVSTIAVSSITASAASCGGNVSLDGGSEVTSRGVCWSTSPNPTISNSHSSNGTGTGSFLSAITGLSPSTLYYVRAYATNSAGTGYGNQKSFTTATSGTNTVTDYDGNVYQTVQIGNQVWMAENLKTTHYANGTALLDGINAGTMTEDYTSKYYFAFNDNESNVSIYGRLYTWAAAVNGSNGSSINPSGVQGICPNGWHIPSKAEFIELSEYLGGDEVAGGKMKEEGITHWNSPNTGATNESGFTALPAGFRWAYYDIYYWFRESFLFWSATNYNEGSSWRGSLDHESSSFFYQASEMKNNGLSVRCVKD